MPPASSSVQQGGHENRFGVVQRPLKVLLRRKAPIKALALRPNCKARFPERPGIENEFIEDQGTSLVARAQAEVYLAIPLCWHVRDPYFPFHATADCERNTFSPAREKLRWRATSRKVIS